jgi:hypothetical protein
MYYNTVKRNWKEITHSFDDTNKVICIYIAGNKSRFYKYQINEETRECLYLGFICVV